jgi:hypothetical protein
MIDINELKCDILDQDSLTVYVPKDDIIDLITRLQEAEKDAERYRFMRGCSTVQSKSFIDPRGGWIYGFGVLDGKIDNAKKDIDDE